MCYVDNHGCSYDYDTKIFIWYSFRQPRVHWVFGIVTIVTVKL